MTDHDKFNEYFQLAHAIQVNVKAGGPITELPSYEQFEKAIPVPFKIASEMKGLEQTMLRPLRQLGDVIEPLADYLKAQSRKIDLMMSYILQSEDEKELQFQTLSYGGGGFTFGSDSPFDTDQYLICKLFFDEEAAAVFCYGKLIETQANQDTGGYINKVMFHYIREDDQEVVVRASLHQQSKQLLKKTQARQQDQQ